MPLTTVVVIVPPVAYVVPVVLPTVKTLPPVGKSTFGAERRRGLPDMVLTLLMLLLHIFRDPPTVNTPLAKVKLEFAKAPVAPVTVRTAPAVPVAP
jgi:hypothetical protein